ncbi:MAG: aspartate kinase [Alphaproteobacteria bacterium]
MKKLIIQKFGGTSVADIECIRNVAKRAKEEVNQGNNVIVVVSAMAGRTNQLVEWAGAFGSLHQDDAFDKEYDAIVSTGEQVTSGLTALALQEIGVDAVSCLGWQVPIATDNVHAKARISSIGSETIQKHLDAGCVVVVPGFQGITKDNRITTLGRGGSDTTAVALAAALDAHRCDIFTDVDGVYTTDPRVEKNARKIEKITYEEMFEMASLGSKILQVRSVEMAMNHQVRLQVRSSFKSDRGTLIVSEEEIMEKEIVSGIAFSRDEAKFTLSRVPDKPGVSAEIFGTLADSNVNVDMIVQVIAGEDALTEMSFTVARGEKDRTIKILENLKSAIGFEHFAADDGVAKVSVIGVGMVSHVGVARKMFKALADRGINIQLISTSEIKISVLIDEEYTELAVRALHDAYNLEKKA